MNRRVEIKKGILGGHSVGYDCPSCAARLKSPLNDAGKADTCPECGTAFEVPGVEERNRLEAEAVATAQRRRDEEAERKRQQDDIRKARLEAEEQQRAVGRASQTKAESEQQGRVQAKGAQAGPGLGSELEFFNERGVIVTSTRFIVAGQTYAMRNITSIKLFSPSVNGQLVLLMISVPHQNLWVASHVG